MITFNTKKKVAVIGSIMFPQPMGIEVKYYNIYNQKPKTWTRKFLDLRSQIDDGSLDGVIIYLATPLFLQVTKSEYNSAWKILAETLPRVRTLVIAFEENLHENFDYYDYETSRFLNLKDIEKMIVEVKHQMEKLAQEEKISDSKVRQDIEEDSVHIFENGSDAAEAPFSYFFDTKLFKLEKAQERLTDFENRRDQVSYFIDSLLTSGLEISSFKEKKTIGYRIETFLEDLLKDVFFSVYVPREQMFADEFEEFIKVFERYIQQVEGLNFSIDTQATNRGVKFYFRSKSRQVNVDSFPQAIKRFSKFMDLCTDNPGAALDLIKDGVRDPNKSLEIVQRFAKRYNRLILDIKHQQERLNLLMKQEFENTIMETDIVGTPALLFDAKGQIKDSIEFMKQQSLAVSRKLAQEETKMLEVAGKYGDDSDLVTVKSNIEMLNDPALSKSDRQSAADKLKSFLLKVSRKAAKSAEDIGVKVLTAYLENMVK